MAKILHFGNVGASYTHSDLIPNLAGTSTATTSLVLAETRTGFCQGLTGSQARAFSLAGPSPGIEFDDGGGRKLDWISEPLSADFTIAGTITINTYTAEGGMNDNAAINFLVEKIDGVTGVRTQICRSARVTELTLTTITLVNFTATPTSTACKKGDRLRVVVFIDDAGTMGVNVGLYCYFQYGRRWEASIVAAGDSWIQFTENLTFQPYPIYYTYPAWVAGAYGYLEIGGVLEPSSSNASGKAFGKATYTTSSPQMISEPFMAQSNVINEFRFWLGKFGNPTDDVVLELRTDNGSGFPTSTVVATIGTAPASGISVGNPASDAVPTHVFSNLGIAVSPGAGYHVVHRRSGALNDTDYYTTHGYGGDVAGWWYSRNYDGATWQTASAVRASMKTNSSDETTYYMTDTAETEIPAVYYGEYQVGAVMNIGSVLSNARLGQSFTALGSTLTEVSFWLGRVNNPNDNLIVEIQTDNAGDPSGTVVGTVATILGSSLLTTVEKLTYTTSISLTPGTRYWIVCRRSGTTSSSAYIFHGIAVSGLPGPTVQWYNGTDPWGNIPGRQAARFSLTFPGTAKKVSRTRGSSAVTAVTNTVTGPTGGVQITNAAGGNPIEWFTAPLEAFTLAGRAGFTLRPYLSNALGAATLITEIAVVDGDGTGAMIWARSGSAGTIQATSEVSYAQREVYLSGPDIAVAAGQRLRFRIYADDGNLQVSGHTISFSYNGPTLSGVAGNSYLKLPVVVVDQEIAGPGPKPIVAAGITNLQSASGTVTKPAVFRPITPAGITNAQAVSGNIRRAIRVTPTGVTNTQSVAGAVQIGIKEAIVPAGITNTQSVSGAITKFQPPKVITPAGITNSQNVSGSVRRLRRITPTGVTNTQNVVGSLRALRRIAPSGITNTQSVVGAVTKPAVVKPIVPPQNYPSVVLADAPNGYWRMGEVSGQPQDSSGNGNHTTGVAGAMVYGQAGAITDGNTAIRFPGTSGNAFYIPDSATLDLGNVFTLEAWIKPTVNGIFHGIYSKSGPSAYSLYISPANTVRLLVGGNLYDSTGLIADTAWHHVVATKNGATIEFYIDGVYQGGTSSATASVNTTDSLVLGCYWDGGAPANATLDELAVYPTVLSAARVLVHYQTGTSGGGAITNTQSVSGAITKTVPAKVIVPAGITNSQNVAGAVRRIARVTPTGITNSQNVSGTIRRLRPVVPTGITNNQTISGAIRKLARIAPTGITNTQSVAGTVMIGAKDLIVAAGIFNSQNVTGSLRRLRPVVPTGITNTQNITGSVGAIKKLVPSAVTNTQNVTGNIFKTVPGKYPTPTTQVLNTQSVSGAVRALHKITPTTNVTFTNNVSGAIGRRRRITPTTTVTNSQTVSGGVTVRRAIKPTTNVTNTQNITGDITMRVAVRPTTVVTFTNLVGGSVTTQPIIVIVPSGITNSQLVSGSVRRLVRVTAGTLTNTQTVTGSVVKFTPPRPIVPTTITNTQNVNGGVRVRRAIRPTTTVTYTNNISGEIVARVAVRPTTTVTFTNNIFGSVGVGRRILPSGITWTNTVAGSVIVTQIVGKPMPLPPGKIVHGHRGRTSPVVIKVRNND